MPTLQFDACPPCENCPSCYFVAGSRACAVGQIRCTDSDVLSHRGGVRAIATDVGSGCGGRVGVARRATQMRTAKSCGPDPPTLGSSWRVDPPATVANKPGHRGERDHKPSTHRAGNAGLSRRTCGDYARVVFSFPREAAGALARPAFPAPSVIEGQCFGIARTQSAPRECTVAFSSLRGGCLTVKSES